MASQPGTLALDFDGVLCDGLQEQFLTSWQAYGQLWPAEATTPPMNLAPLFYELRPVITVGWEMPVLLRAIITGCSPQDIFAHWAEMRDRLLQDQNLNAQTLGKLVDDLRDRWIEKDEEGWLNHHQFYPGTIECLGAWLSRAQDQKSFRVVIVTTKETRFVVALLNHAGLNFPQECIFGKDRQQPKTVILEQFLQDGMAPLWFVEDRLGALKKVASVPALNTIKLFLAGWGYNTTGDRQEARHDERVHLLDLDQFTQGSEDLDFAGWLTGSSAVAPRKRML